jgi:hypothetical protein
LRLDNLEGRIIYGQEFERDAIECRRLNNVSFLQMMPIAGCCFHGTAALFTKREDELKRAILNSSAKSADDAYFSQENGEDMTRDFLDSLNPEAYSLSELIESWHNRVS